MELSPRRGRGLGGGMYEVLRMYPADMEKNERWKMIAKGVPGKTKKECVDRFKAIREAVRQGKS